MDPETRYARSGDLSIAYQVIGQGPRDIVLVPGFISHVEFFHEVPGYSAFLDGLAGFARVIVFDKRGNGLSDRVAGAPSLEERMDDIRAVMDAAGSNRAALFAISEGGPLSLLFAATFPERVEAIVLYETFVRWGGVADYPIGFKPDLHAAITSGMVELWGTGGSLFALGSSRWTDPRARALWGRAERLSSSPGGVLSIYTMMFDIDVRAALPSVRAPCLILYSRGFSMFKAHSDYLAEHLSDARLVGLDGVDHYPWFAGGDRVVAEAEQFLTGARTVVVTDRLLATVLFIDIAGSTERAAEQGDRRWHESLQKFYQLVRRQLERFRGMEVDTAGDGVFARFDGPARAVSCACAIRDGVRGLELEIRAGLHTGEIECREDGVTGLAIVIGARVCALAEAGEVLVSRTVKDLVVGSGLQFSERGTHSLKGVPETWQLFAAGGQAK